MAAPASWTFDAIGTSWQVDASAPLGPPQQVEVLGLIEDFDRTWSRFRSDSVVAEMARSAGEWRLPGGAELLDLYDELDRVTDGAVNPLVGRTLSDLGYDAAYSLRPSADPSPAPAWSTLERVGDLVRTTEPVLLDVGAAGKGLLVDRVAALLGERGEDALVVDAGGDLVVAGGTRRVALESPWDTSRALGVVELSDAALCGSATNRRAWGDGLHHVLDARTGRPTAGVVATWVVAEECMVADALATAHFFAEPEPLLERWRHQFVRVHADGGITWSPDLPGEMFL